MARHEYRHNVPDKLVAAIEVATERLTDAVVAHVSLSVDDLAVGGFEYEDHDSECKANKCCEWREEE